MTAKVSISIVAVGTANFNKNRWPKGQQRTREVSSNKPSFVGTLGSNLKYGEKLRYSYSQSHIRHHHAAISLTR